MKVMQPATTKSHAQAFLDHARHLLKLHNEAQRAMNLVNYFTQDLVTSEQRRVIEDLRELIDDGAAQRLIKDLRDSPLPMVVK